MSSDLPDDDRTIIRPSGARTAPNVPADEGVDAGATEGGSADAGPAEASSGPEATTQPVTEPLAAAITAPTAPPLSAAAAAARAEQDENALPAGTYLGEFEITEVLGIGGFGIVYLAWDHSLHRKVAVKEYMPTALAARQGPTEVRVKSARHRDTFEAGLKSFVNEARLLAQFDHPALVKVYRFWEAHGTAYMVMPFYEGVTLKDTLLAMGTPPSEAWLRNLLAPLTEALQVIHSEQCFHRDIAPDNVILLKGSNRPLLLDFGAARRVIGDMTQALTVILKPGYAPLEQYAEVPGMKQGAWTDVYALCAVVYYAIVGKTPPTSVGRLVNDSYVPLAEQQVGQYSDHFLRAIDRGLQVKPDDRTQSIEELRSDLALSATRFNPDVTQQVSLSDAGMSALAGAKSAASASAGAKAASPAATAIAPARSKTPLYLGIAVVVLAAVGYGVFSLLAPTARPPGSPSVADVATPGATPVPPPASAVVAPPADTAVATAPAPAPAPAPASPPPYDPLREFDLVVQGQTAGFNVITVPSKTTFRIDRDRLQFNVTSSRDGFVYVLLRSTEGGFMLLLPNDHARANTIKAGQTLTLPPSSWPLDVAGPPGTDEFLVVVSASPRDFARTGLKNEQGIGRFPSAGTSTAPGATSAYGGEPKCKAGAECSTDYGATRFSVTETR